MREEMLFWAGSYYVIMSYKCRKLPDQYTSGLCLAT